MLALYLADLPAGAREHLAGLVPEIDLRVLPSALWAPVPDSQEPLPVVSAPGGAYAKGEARAAGGADGVDSPAALAIRCEIAIGGVDPPGFLDAAKRLRWWIVPFAGIPAATRAALRERPGVVVMNSHFNARHTAEHAWALLLAAAKQIVPCSERLRHGDWRPRYDAEGSLGLYGATLLLIGYGAIGRALVPMARGFGMKVMAVRRRAVAAPELDAVGTRGELHSFLAQADAVILALPATERTDGYLGAKEFAAMKSGAIVVNVGRGSALDESALHAALASGRLGGAAIDTWWVYPTDEAARSRTRPSHLDFSSFSNLVFSPHRASHVRRRDEDRWTDLAGLLRSIVERRPINVVDLEAGY